eukprot:evm.model.scf_33.3 EVM.evm.TU.scf_33.3   scf_33:72945-74024(+)
MNMAPPLNPSANPMFQQYATSHSPAAYAVMPPCPRPAPHQQWPQGPHTSGALIRANNGSSSAIEPGPTGRGSQAGVGTCAASGRTSDGKGLVNLDVDFPGLVVTRKSKALKLISPETNAPISPERGGLPSTSVRGQEQVKDGAPTIPSCGAEEPRSRWAGEDCVATRGKALEETAWVSQIQLAAGPGLDKVSGPTSPTSGLPIGSKLRRWMVSPRPGSSMASSVDGDIDGSDLAGTGDGLHLAEGKPHDKMLTHKFAGAVECEEVLNNCSAGIGKETVGGSQSSRACQQEGTGSADPANDRMSGAKAGVCEADSEGTSVLVKGANTDAVLARKGHRVHSQASGIPRSSRLHMWMGQSEG